MIEIYCQLVKQYAEEKFSATSLSATNLRGENTKSKAARDYRLLYSNTPIRMGNMEILDLDHLGPDIVITALLLHSVSPHARKLVEQFSTGDPYVTNIRLDDESKNRQAEVVETYLRAIGLRLKFTKHSKKKIHPIIQYPMEIQGSTFVNPIIEIPDNLKTDKEVKDYVAKANKHSKEIKAKLNNNEMIDPIILYDVPKFEE